MRVQAVVFVLVYLATHPSQLLNLARSLLGGGTTIDDWRIVRAHWDNAVLIRWERGDVLLLDNHVVAHGRMPFRGKRDIVGVLAN